MYKLINDPITGKLACIQKLSNNVFIPINENNTDYQAYLKWVAEGNQPEPAQ